MLAVSTKLDISGLRRRMEIMNRNRPAARRQATIVKTKAVMDLVVRHANRDTHRYVLGWEQAANAAGIGPYHEEALSQAKWYGQYLKKLALQYRFWSHIVRAYEHAGRQNEKGYRLAMKKQRRAKEELDKIRGKGGDTAIVVDLLSRDRLATVRPTVYGGTGGITGQGTQTRIVLFNREPHVRFVEHRFHIVQAAIAAIYGQARVRAAVARTWYRLMMGGKG